MFLPILKIEAAVPQHLHILRRAGLVTGENKTTKDDFRQSKIYRKPSFVVSGCLAATAHFALLSKFYSFFLFDFPFPDRRHDHGPGFILTSQTSFCLKLLQRRFEFCSESIISALILYYENLMAF
ncbi:hypothetical protein [Desulfitobacterium chlororespirans]|uniref:hypothetical protein n=1 Tax=Desulfitobacterium chlororespirans TaxID=51616 RepID=UPI0015B480A7|nr:hypothetical protein [Desulfitobacterium chlororespirans]